ncbi:hypothetical protein GMDG_03927 [Pseudogymnoascus destructans 20631-21]|uniref:Dihydrolipoamide acetyltransferase component of pyruvate dehydrogenase complex n=1 Tax=Pseudogymnoascus destructans (strain ATCC MYA-4855 / 20631-21) TaxID=658429 RepID=L8GBE6_PSED2|nr:hypothetical protein GMDG_03927 [Pseudogymnoascus destructans 20631-21]
MPVRIPSISAAPLSRALLNPARRNGLRRHPTRLFTATARAEVVKPFLLADIGEGIRECEIIQWFVEPGARVEEFDKICEVQSDKASVEIPSRFSGVIKKLHYDTGEMAKVGKALVDIDVPEEVAEAVEQAGAAPLGREAGAESVRSEGLASTIQPDTSSVPPPEMKPESDKPVVAKGKHATLATPAVRHLTKELKVDISDINGSGRDGRVTKDDVYQFAKARDAGQAAPTRQAASTPQLARPAPDHGPPQETPTQLTNMQAQMFKAMTASLRIPHFLYADEIDVSSLFHLRQRLNKSLAKSPPVDAQATKLSILPFLIKAMSLAIGRYPILNARVDVGADSKPSLVMRAQHNIGIAMDTPQGLLVPVIKNANALSILSIASELARLQALAKAGNLTTADLTGGTITLSNIGNIGGTYVAPVIVEKEVAILGIGKRRTVPAFGEGGRWSGRR